MIFLTNLNQEAGITLILVQCHIRQCRPLTDVIGEHSVSGILLDYAVGHVQPVISFI